MATPKRPTTAVASAAAPVLIEGQEYPLSMDLTGKLRTLAVFTGTLEVNLDLADDEVMTGVTPDSGSTRVLTKGDASGRPVVTGEVNSFTPIAAGTTNVAGLAAATGRRLIGFAAAETAAVPANAQIILRHGTANTDPIIADIHLGPWESTRDGTSLFGVNGIAVPSGVFIDRNGVGSSQITLIHRTET